jgi:hypothetical protein
MPADPGTEAAAIAALQEDGGCTEDRARALVAAVRTAAADEALAIVAGDEQPVGSAVDRRVATLHRIVAALPDGEPLPNSYELGVIFRITPSQGRSVLRTYQARFSKSYRGRLESALKALQPTKKAIGGTNVFVFSVDDPALLDHAVDFLRRRGLTRSVTVDRTLLTLTVNRDEHDRFGKDAARALAAAGQ